jgi:hypothetical protein
LILEAARWEGLLLFKKNRENEENNNPFCPIFRANEFDRTSCG